MLDHLSARNACECIELLSIRVFKRMISLFLSSLIIIPELDIDLIQVSLEEVPDYLICLLKIWAS